MAGRGGAGILILCREIASLIARRGLEGGSSGRWQGGGVAWRAESMPGDSLGPRSELGAAGNALVLTNRSAIQGI